MKFRLTLFTLLVAALVVLPAAAQDSPNNTVTFNEFSFTYDKSLADNVSIVQHTGDAPDVQQPGGPTVKRTEFDLYSGDTVPESYNVPYAIQVYETADFKGYGYATQQMNDLLNLVNNQPDLATYTTVDPNNSTSNALPYMPEFPAVQVIRARVQYTRNATLQGISYITIFKSDVSPFTSDEFFYTFQGFSNDGLYYVSAVFRVNANVFPAAISNDFDYNAFDATFTDFLNESVKKLNDAKPRDFTPSLDTLDKMIQSFTLNG